MSNPSDGPAVIITTQTMERLRSRIQPGDRITFAMPVFYGGENGQSRRDQYRRVTGTVVRKYPHLVQAQDKAGRVVTVAYRDIVAVRKGGGRDG